MNFKTLKLSLALVALSVSANVHAYRWIFSNFTNKTLILQVELKGSSNPYFYLVTPDKTADFEWGFGNPKLGFCLGKVKWIEVNDWMRKPEWGMIKNDKILDNYKAQAFFNHNRGRFPLKEAQIKFETDPLFQQTVKSGTALGGKLVQWIAKAIAESNCRSRDYAVVEENGNITCYTKAN